MRRLIVSAICYLLVQQIANAAEFVGDFRTTADRIWIGRDYWANPMEDWRVHGGRLECLNGGPNRSVHLLTRQLAAAPGAFTMSVVAGRLDAGPGSVGFRVGIRDEIDDYRSWLIRGTGIDAGLTTDGTLILGAKTFPSKLAAPLPEQFELTLQCQPLATGMHRLELSVHAGAGEAKRLAGSASADFPADKLHGNIAIVNNHKGDPKKGAGSGARFWFSNWRVAGDKISAHDERAFGPILWSMHTLSRGVLKMTAQLPPVGADDPQTVTLQIKKGAEWKTIAEEKVQPLSYTATFRVPDWNDKADLPYRLVYGNENDAGRYLGVIRKDPVAKPSLGLAALSCQGDMAFPNREIAGNLKKLDPDLLFFAGDQIYESSGGFPLIRTPTDRACLNYLRKWYLFGMSFGDLMRDRPTVCIPDDHDVYQGNIWGNGGNATTIAEHAGGGYIQDADFVNTVHRTQSAHLPDAFDPTPIKQGITVYYGSMVYGRVGFAIIADRMFKSGPLGTVATWQGRPDHVTDPKIDVKKLDRPGLELLGERQGKFLTDWAGDWRGVDLKVVLSQTNFCNVANYHGANEEYLVADLDSGGWPQTPRNRAVELMRRGFALHVCGDQHLTTLVHYGIETPGDSNYCFCVPAIANVYPRRWTPDKEGKPATNRALVGGLANTGDYRDGLGNPIRVVAVGNPADVYRKERIAGLHDKACGFGIIRCNHQDRSFTLESYRLLIDVANPRKDDQFPGWPRTIKMLDNYGRTPTGYLPTLEVKGRDNPVVQVVDEQTKETVYTLRIQGNSFRPMVFSPGPFTVHVGEAGSAREIQHVQPTEDRKRILRVEVP